MYSIDVLGREIDIVRENEWHSQTWPAAQKSRIYLMLECTLIALSEPYYQALEYYL